MTDQLTELQAAAERLKRLLETTWTGEDSPDTLQLPRFDDKRFYIAAKKYMPALLARLADLERLREFFGVYPSENDISQPIALFRLRSDAEDYIELAGEDFGCDLVVVPVEITSPALAKLTAQ